MAKDFDLTTVLRQLCRAAKPLAVTSGATKNQVLRAISTAVTARAEEILEANTLDLEQRRGEAVPSWELDSLKLTPERLQYVAEQLHQLAVLSDPIGAIDSSWRFDTNITMTRYRIPLGAIALAYEIYPEWCLNGIGMALKTGNSIIVTSDRRLSATQDAMVEITRTAAYEAGLPEGAIQSIPGGETDDFISLLRQSRYLKLVLACGRRHWVAEIAERSAVTTLTAELPRCLIYIDKSATWEQVWESVLRHPCLPDCRASATSGKRLIYHLPYLQCLLHADWAQQYFDAFLTQLRQQECELRGRDMSTLSPTAGMDSSLPRTNVGVTSGEPTTGESEIQVERVADMDEAIAFVDTLGDGRAVAIVTDSQANARRFARQVDSSVVFINRFPDVAEIARSSTGAYLGWATPALPARGLVDLQALTTVKYLAEGD
ncbi:MAG: aldehyde dehydrogenase family protein [Cyanobacteria bacterium P01_D01_bin.123]